MQKDEKNKASKEAEDEGKEKPEKPADSKGAKRTAIKFMPCLHVPSRISFQAWRQEGPGSSRG